MKITFIIATLNSGGAERVLVTLANALCKEHEICIIKFHKEDSFYPLEHEICVKTLPEFRFDTIYHKIASRFKKFFALRLALKESKSDVFISFLDTTNIACIVAKWGLRTPLIISEHSHQSYLKPKIWRFLRRMSYPYANALTVLSSSDKNYYENFVKRVILLPNPCHFTLENKEFKKENLVLFVGRLDKNKNPQMFIRAFENLEENLRQNCEFIVAGDGELKEELKLRAKGLNIKFLGKVEDIKSLYERAKVLCLCSFIEGLPTVLIESLYFEVCRISSAYTAGAKDLIEDLKDGFIVPCDDDLAMAERISLVLNDEQLRLNLVCEAKKRCENYEISNIKEKWLVLIKELREHA
ncbi:glycosyltransferase [Campylobacter cuniculorum]|uniref:GalNAc-alpha-(1,4)-GalNAc-alpha-(1, 3)-diNAcBac-PP-undecaprenol alpha-1,4-N-acetyl-D-galactosaminyltransferase n=2 Tax=Campylobacter cuniculorum TaxID=374106 RepID=A0A1W6BXE8_9BACT|nr:glycosyltransferase [Campylobacter cuniculorum]ARJ56761.1 GalNAc-alpha-(1,4)-GalNAc-alpha-(1,3)-diNAcBac-PP-undecaprenol alpha-1,4-N-acetyl-D-galactosaminyltransferase [Campylobacter cuniculorum DSM 23162 = LMG 24588]QOR04231.1 glycosyltransferase [Campylobacter cuniculorum]